MNKPEFISSNVKSRYKVLNLWCSLRSNGQLFKLFISFFLIIIQIYYAHFYWMILLSICSFCSSLNQFDLNFNFLLVKFIDDMVIIPFRKESNRIFAENFIFRTQNLLWFTILFHLFFYSEQMCRWYVSIIITFEIIFFFSLRLHNNNNM